MPKVIMAFDMRAPHFGAPIQDLYGVALEMAEYADQNGFDLISLCEHHGSEDGYLPSPFILGGGIAARTHRIRIMLGAVILSFHDPVKIAEQIAVLDIMSGGRLEITFGAGYVPSEFRMFGISLQERAKRLDSGIEIIIRALNAERFVAEGREIFVRPLPLQKPHPPIYIGGGVPASALRAARFGAGLAPMNLDIVPLYQEERRKRGLEPGPVLIKSPPLSIYLSEDPARGWDEIAIYAEHVASSYADWGADTKNSSSPLASLVTPEAVKASGMFRVVTPDQCVELAVELDKRGTALCIYPLLGGMPPELAWKSLTLFTERVLPRLKGGVS